jgi:hypothetical protein
MAVIPQSVFSDLGPTMMTRIVDFQVFPDRIAQPGGPLWSAMREAGEIAVEETRKYISKHDLIETKALYKSIRFTRTRRVGASQIAIDIGTDKRYAQWVHEGVKGWIYPKSAPMLRFTPKASRRNPTTGQFQTGTVIYAKRVRGQSGKPFLTEGGLEGLRRRGFPKGLDAQIPAAFRVNLPVTGI